MKKVSSSSAVAIVIAIVFVAVISFVAGSLKTKATFNNYYNKTEVLLDSIYYQQPEYFDMLIESDVYYYYQEAKNDLN